MVTRTSKKQDRSRRRGERHRIEQTKRCKELVSISARGEAAGLATFCGRRIAMDNGGRQVRLNGCVKSEHGAYQVNQTSDPNKYFLTNESLNPGLLQIANDVIGAV